MVPGKGRGTASISTYFQIHANGHEDFDFWVTIPAWSGLRRSSPEDLPEDALCYILKMSGCALPGFCSQGAVQAAPAVYEQPLVPDKRRSPGSLLVCGGDALVGQSLVCGRS